MPMASDRPSLSQIDFDPVRDPVLGPAKGPHPLIVGGLSGLSVRPRVGSAEILKACNPRNAQGVRIAGLPTLS